MKGFRLVSLLASVLLILSMSMAAMPASTASAGPAPTGQAQGSSGETLGYDPDTGHLIFIGAPQGSAIASAAGDLSALSAKQQADSFVNAYASAFGLSNPSQELDALSTSPTTSGGNVTRYQQVYQGVPVFGGNLVVSTTDEGGLVAMAGKFSTGLTLSVAPSVDADKASGIAQALVAKLYELQPEQMKADVPALWVYDEKIFTDSIFGPQLVWRVEVSGLGFPIREVVLVNAQTGKVSQHYNEIDTSWALNGKLGTRKPSERLEALAGGTPLWSIYTNKNGWLEEMPGMLICDETTGFCGSDAQVLDARDYTLDTYDFYWNLLGRDSIDDAGMRIISTIHYGNPSTSKNWFKNAYWDGDQMVYGDRVAVDDVVAHELTHGVTENTSGLLYLYQPGAINESMSDVFGELIDLSNVDDYYVNDTTGRWLIGESIEGPRKAFRNMKNPPQFRDPDKMTSALYYKKADDNGGVHTNSGVNNKAAYLMVDGGVFNGYTVTGIGINKVAALYYEVQTNYLFPGADYLDLYYALNGACTAMVGGPEGITAPDCEQVEKATKAVQMDVKPPAVNGPAVDACPAGYSKSTSVFTEDFESGTAAWSFTGTGTDIDYSDTWPFPATTTSVPPSWNISEYPDSMGTGSGSSSGSVLWGGGPDGLNNWVWNDNPYYGFSFRDYDLVYAYEDATLASPLILPAGKQIYLTFDHMHMFESYGPSTNFDGGILEYSDNGGVWTDAKLLFNAGTNYNGTVVNYGTDAAYQPLSARQAFVANSLNGVLHMRYNLTSLAGHNVRFRFRAGYDSYTDWGWFIDNISVHTCIGTPTVPLLVAPLANALVTDYTPTLDWSDSAPASDLSWYRIQIDDDMSTVIDEPVFGASNFTVPDLDALEPNTTYYWRVAAYNSENNTRGWSLVRTFRTAIEPPVLASPDFTLTDPDPVQLDNKRPTLDWAPVTGAATYTVEASLVPTFASKAFVATTAATDYTHKADLLPDKVYYWRVKANTAKGGNGPSAYSEVWQFTTANAPSAPALVLPANKALVPTYTPKLDWNPSVLPLGTTLDHYQVQVDNNEDFGSVAVSADVDDLLPTEYTIPLVDALDPNTTYYWRVRAVNTDVQYSAWSLVRTFRTAIEAPLLTSPDFTLTDPDPVQLDNKRPTLDWEPVAGAATYTVEASLFDTFASKAFVAITSATDYTHKADLLPDTTYYWRVKANVAKGGNGPSAYSEVWQFTTVNPPSAPVLVVPKTKSLVAGLTPLLDWKDSILPVGSTLDHYQVQVDNNEDFGSAEVDANVVPTEYTIPLVDALDPNTTYYWRVRAVDTGTQFSAWSLVWNFRTAIEPPVLTSPANPSTLDNKRPTLDWGSVPGAVSYTVEVSLFDTFASKAFMATTSATTYTHKADLLPDKVYYWRVKANAVKGGNGPSAYSEVWQFTTGNPPSVPVLVLPANKALVTTYTPRLDWNPSVPPLGTTLDHYQVQVDNNADFGSAEVDANVVPTEYIIPLVDALDPNTTYYWRVRAVNTDVEYSAWSLVRTFRTILAAPVLTAPADGIVTTTYRPIFNWDDVPGAVSYTIQVSRVSNFATTVVNLTPTGSASTWASVANLPKGEVFWRVKANGAKGGNGPSAWSDVGSFYVVNISAGGLDSDGDGLPNDWEINGYDADGDKVIDINLPALGADPYHKDIFVEMDWMPDDCGGTIFTYGLAPNATVMDAIVDVFANAPVTNPDGTTGINIHLDLSNEVACDEDLNPVESEFYALKEANFDPKRAAIYHYMIWAVGYNGDTSSGLSFGIPATDFIVTLGSWGPLQGTDPQKIGTFIHELGHNLNLTHGGTDHVNYKPNYLSIMNYFFQTSGLFHDGHWGYESSSYYLNFDYQRINVAPLNEAALSETLGLGAAAAGYGTKHICPWYSLTPYDWWWDDVLLPKIDWNCSNIFSGTVNADVNDDGRISVLTSQNNWQFIVYNGGGIIGSGASPEQLLTLAENTPIIEWNELTFEMQQKIDKMKNSLP